MRGGARARGRAGQALRREVELTWRGLEEMTVRGLDDDERVAVRQVLERLEGNLGRALGEDDGPV
ncbi:hypothetical protein JOF41_001155 [Saccharothrix coeruleofusca]|uniref:hypothetical protein n=1 Tax=Saccharothrix coeruleofusca TaxID=33919 RepID=UPI001AE643A0|nr:hypothetical protein [Saccharothrix coeruleofusca]MBP2334977.1 hypothetical protein [Saccharothrix coeruleofusca]